MTVTDFEIPDGTDGGNALVAMDIDVEKFWEVTLGTYTRVAASLGALPGALPGALLGALLGGG
jgi:hypothetical protein